MKSLLLTSLLLTNQVLPSLQIVVYNTSNNVIYVLDVQDEFTLIPINDENYAPIACLENKLTRFKDVDFTHPPKCLMESLNEAYDMHITQYVNLNNQTDQKEMKKLIEEKNLVDLINFYRTVNTSFTLMDLYQNYMTYKDTALSYTAQYPFLIQVGDGYLALSSK